MVSNELQFDENHTLRCQFSSGQELRRTQMEEICDKLKNLELVKSNLEREFTQCHEKLEEQKLKLEADTKGI